MNFEWFEGLGLILLIPFLVFDLILKGIALWKSAKNGQKVWFITLLIVNSIGILPLIYLLLQHCCPTTSKKKK
ncbi:MAG: DUF5652 family protein [Candidatus Woesebacteria bacterium]|nr:DUF5652 family protein [Candidatus Woesebacteria bacterium]